MCELAHSIGRDADSDSSMGHRGAQHLEPSTRYVGRVQNWASAAEIPTGRRGWTRGRTWCRTPWGNRDATYVATVPASTENLKGNWEVLRVEREPNGCSRANLNLNLNLVALVRVPLRGQESLGQAVKEGGLVSIRDNEAEGECRHIPIQFVDFFVCSSLSQLSVALSLSSLCLRTLLSGICSFQCDNRRMDACVWLKVLDTEKEAPQVSNNPSV